MITKDLAIRLLVGLGTGILIGIFCLGYKLLVNNQPFHPSELLLWGVLGVLMGIIANSLGWIPAITTAFGLVAGAVAEVARHDHTEHLLPVFAAGIAALIAGLVAKKLWESRKSPTLGF